MANNDFWISINSKVNLNNVKKEVDSFINKKRDLKLDFDASKVTKNIKLIQDAIDSAQTRMSKFSQYAELMGDAKINNNLRNMAKVINDMNAPVKETSTSFSKWADAEGNIFTETVKFDNELGKTITKVKEYKNALGQTVTETKVFNGNMELLSKDINTFDDRLEREIKALKEEQAALDASARSAQTKYEITRKNAEAQIEAQKAIDNAVTNSRVDTYLSNAQKSARNFASEMATTINKVAKFYVATLPIQAMSQAISESVSIIKEYDAAMVEFNKVTLLSDTEINKMIGNFDKLSVEVGRTKTELVAIATEMSKAGFGNTEEEVTRMTELTALYQNTADEELSAADASAVLISQMRAFNYTADEAIHVLDSINKVSAEFAVSSGDIGRGLTQAGAALQTYGNDFDEVVGMVTGASEIFIGRSQQVARG